MQIIVKTLCALCAIFASNGLTIKAYSKAQESTRFTQTPLAPITTQESNGESLENQISDRSFPRFKPGKFQSPAAAELNSGPSRSARPIPPQSNFNATAPPIDENTLRSFLQPPADAAVPSQRSRPDVNSDPMQELSPSRLAPMGDPDAAKRQSAPSILVRQRGQSAEAPQSNAPSFSQQPSSALPVKPRESPASNLGSRPSSAVQPVSYNSPLTQAEEPKKRSDASKRSSLENARQLVQLYDVSNAAQPLPGVPVSMLEMLERTPPQLHAQMISQYWETFYDWASLINRNQYVQWLNQIPTPRVQLDNILLFTAKSDARNQALAAEIQLGKSQSRLQEFIRDKDSQQFPPLPLDQPLISKYKTHYQWYASRKMIPSKLEGIQQMLPKTLELIVSRAETVRNAQSVTRQTQAALADGQINVASLLEAGRLWQDSLQGLVGAVVSYNQAVADYALTISPNKTAEQIVGMLIKVPSADAVIQDSSDPTSSSGFAGTHINQVQSGQGLPMGSRTPSLDAASWPGRSNGNRPNGSSANLYRNANEPQSSPGQSDSMPKPFSLPVNSNSRITPSALIPAARSVPGQLNGKLNSSSDTAPKSSFDGSNFSGGDSGGGSFSPQPPTRPGSNSLPSRSDFGGGS